MSVNARPFLKWAGGKASLLPELLKRVPTTYGAYHEPFLGGGALFFALRPGRAYLSDANAVLIAAYAAVRDKVDDLIALLKAHGLYHNEKYYYEMRSVPLADDFPSGARLIYLNKTCFNGLYRVNRSGTFNVPFGKRKNPTICDEQNLRMCSQALNYHVQLSRSDFKVVDAHAVWGDLVYFDSPYVPLSTTSNFASYTAAGFSHKDQIDLRDLALTLKRRGVHVMLSNSGSAVVEKLYAKDFKIEAVKCRRSINSKGDKRGEITEYIIT